MLGPYVSQLAVGVALAAVVVRYALSFWRNYKYAKGSGLPFIVSPINPLSTFWLALQSTKIFPIKNLMRLIPGRIGRTAEYLFPGWQLHDPEKIHKRLGKNFFQVTPTGLFLHVGDPLSAYDVFTRWKDFPKLRQLYGALTIFGENLTTSEGPTWQRHKKLTAPSFNERSSKYVWEESIKQVWDMLDLRVGPNGFVTNNLETDCRDVTLHVLCYAGFNVRYKFGEGVGVIPDGHSMSLRDALFRSIRNVFLIHFIPIAVLLLPLAPAEWQATGRSVQEFKRYMAEAIRDERDRLSRKEPGERDTFYGALIRASLSEEASEEETGAGRRLGLTDEEVYGNVFIFNTAGHDTGANSILFALAMLALEPKWQEWIYEELVHYDFCGHVDDYEKTYPKLLRCIALMLESARLYGPVAHIPKITPPQGTVTLDTSTREQILLPPSTPVFVNVRHVGCDTDTWGPDGEVFRPSRWIETSTEKPSGSPFEDAVLKAPPSQGAFLVWGAGVRSCPGRKFSQVEFVAAIAAILSKARVEPVLSPQQTRELESQGVSNAAMQELARQNMRQVIKDVSLKMTVALLRPKDLYIKWRRI